MQKKLNDIIGYQPITIAADHMAEIHKVMDKCDLEFPNPDENRLWSACKLFTLGYLAGIRAERKKRLTHGTPWKFRFDQQEGRH